MAAFAESHVEAAALAWLAELGYATANGQDIGPLQRHQVIERRPPHERSRPGLGLHADQCIVGFSVRISSSIRRRARDTDRTVSLISVSMFRVSSPRRLNIIPR